MIVLKKFPIKAPSFRFLEILSPKEKIYGLSITPDALRAILLGPEKILAKIEVLLPKDTIVKGQLQQKEALVKAAKILRAQLKSPLAIVSLPLIDIWVKVYSFPIHLSWQQVEEAIQLSVESELPFDSKQAFVDWEEIQTSRPDFRELVLMAVRKETAQPFLEALSEARITPIAVESLATSAARSLAIVQPSSGPTLNPAIFIFPDFLIESILHQKTARFLRTLAELDISEEKITKTIKTLSQFFGAEYPESPAGQPIFVFSSDEELSQKLQELSLKERFELQDFTPPSGLPSPLWIFAYGAASRGLIPRDQDRLISLMSIGTEEAYQKQVTQSFVELAGNFVVGTSIFIFLILVISSFWFVSQANQIESRLQALPPPQIKEEPMAKKVDRFNTSAKEVSDFLKASPNWGILLGILTDAENPGIILTEIKASFPKNTLSLSGIAKTRSSLLDYKNALAKSPLSAQIQLPVAILEKESNIEFSFEIPLTNEKEILNVPL